MRAIETTYAGCRFRSRLEARWAVFFDTLRIPWEYELEGFPLSGGVGYLPDFFLPECGTWIEVKGHEGAVDYSRLMDAAVRLPRLEPRSTCEQGPKLLLLGPHPRPVLEGDWGWVGWSYDGEVTIEAGRYGFGSYSKNQRPWWHDQAGDYFQHALEPVVSIHEPGVPNAYEAARSARFEHGQSGAS